MLYFQIKSNRSKAGYEPTNGFQTRNMELKRTRTWDMYRQTLWFQATNMAIKPKGAGMLGGKSFAAHLQT